MAGKQDVNWRNELVRCECCGEDYSVTYKRCPFCDGKAGQNRPDEVGGSRRGGKRVAPINGRGGYGRPMEPVQIIGLALSIILIIAAIYIVFTVLSPLFAGKEPAVSESSSPSVSQSQSSASGEEPDVSGSTSGDVSDPAVVPDQPDVSVEPPAVTTTATGITLSAQDFTLKADESYRISATLAPAGCTDTVTWTSSNESAAAVSQDGTITNVNKGTSQVTVTITAQVGSVSATCTVRCKAGSTGTAGTTTGTTGTTAAAGSTGVVTGTTTGLLIRSGPGREYPAQDTAQEGAAVTILETSGDWYKIQYVGNGGKSQTGYASKDYIKVG